MELQATVFLRLLKFLRVEERISTASVTEDTALSESPIGFSDDLAVDRDFRHRVGRWFEDIVRPIPQGKWDTTSTLGAIAKDIVTQSKADKLVKDYEVFAVSEVEKKLDRAAGAGAQSIPVSERSAVRDRLNVSLVRWLLRDVALSDLAGDRASIVKRIVSRMIV
jgi:hypothetical protein